MRMNKIDLFKVGVWFFFAGLVPIPLCVFPEIPIDPIVEFVSWFWAISVTILLCNLIDKIIIKLKKQKEETDT